MAASNKHCSTKAVCRWCKPAHAFADLLTIFTFWQQATVTLLHGSHCLPAKRLSIGHKNANFPSPIYFSFVHSLCNTIADHMRLCEKKKQAMKTDRLGNWELRHDHHTRKMQRRWGISGVLRFHAFWCTIWFNRCFRHIMSGFLLLCHNVGTILFIELKGLWLNCDIELQIF